MSKPTDNFWEGAAVALIMFAILGGFALMIGASQS